MKDIGQFLKAAREQQGRTIDEVAKVTKIHPYKIKAIEEADEQYLPAKVFYIGLVKSYARELKVDINHIDKLCDEAFTEVVEEHDQPLVHPEPEPTESQKVGRFQVPKSLIILGSLLLTAALMGLIYLLVSKMNSYSKEELVPDDIMNTASGSPSSEQTINETPSPEITKNQTPPPSPISEKKVEKTEPIESVKMNDIEPEADELPTEEPPQDTVKSLPKLEEKKEITPQTTEVKPKKKIEAQSSSYKLVINALEPIQVEVVWSDGFIQKILMKTQENKTFVFTTPIKLRINNGGAVKLSYNGANPEVPGSLNKPIELNYP